MTNPEGLITTAEAAEMLGCSVRQVARKVRAGLIKPAVKIPGLRGPMLFERAHVAAMAEMAEPEERTA